MGTTVLLCTHDLAEAETLAERIGSSTEDSGRRWDGVPALAATAALAAPAAAGAAASR